MVRNLSPPLFSTIWKQGGGEKVRISADSLSVEFLIPPLVSYRLRNKGGIFIKRVQIPKIFLGREAAKEKCCETRGRIFIRRGDFY